MLDFSNASCGRFYIAWDMNLDGAITISDLWLLTKFMWLLPSKLVMELIGGSAMLAQFLEIDCNTGESFGGGVFSFFMWCIAFLTVTNSLSNQKT